MMMTTLSLTVISWLELPELALAHHKTLSTFPDLSLRNYNYLKTGIGVLKDSSGCYVYRDDMKA